MVSPVHVKAELNSLELPDYRSYGNRKALTHVQKGVVTPESGFDGIRTNRLSEQQKFSFAS